MSIRAVIISLNGRLHFADLQCNYNRSGKGHSRRLLESKWVSVCLPTIHYSHSVTWHFSLSGTVGTNLSIAIWTCWLKLNVQIGQSPASSLHAKPTHAAERPHKPSPWPHLLPCALQVMCNMCRVSTNCTEAAEWSTVIQSSKCLSLM